MAGEAIASVLVKFRKSIEDDGRSFNSDLNKGGKLVEYIADENFNRISKDLKHGVPFSIGRFCDVQYDVIMGSNVVVGDYTKIMPHTRIGDNTEIMDYVKLMPGTIIGNNCKLDDYVNTSGYVEIGNNVRIKRCSMIGQAVRIEKAIQEEKEEEEWITLKKGCMIGSASIVLAGTTVGEGAVIGAGSVVTKDCEPWGVYVGNPATFRRQRVRQ